MIEFGAVFGKGLSRFFRLKVSGLGFSRFDNGVPHNVFDFWRMSALNLRTSGLGFPALGLGEAVSAPGRVP